MKIALTITSIIFTAFQALINYAWQSEEEDVTGNFLTALQSLYGEVPKWTETAFSLGNTWYFISLFVAACAIAGYFLIPSRLALLVLTLASILITISMVYAMYPLHLMANGIGI